MNNLLDIEVSCFKNYFTENNPQSVDLLTWLRSAKYASVVRQIRAEKDKDKRNQLKAKLPAITPSGLFTKRQQDALVTHSRLMQFDIDSHDNEHVTNFHELKEHISRLQEVAYCGLSVSGRGFWGLIPIAFPDKHKSHFQALKEDFRKWGIVLDDAPGNVASLRGYSYDPEGYFNPQAKVYTKLFESDPEQYRRGCQRRQLDTDEAMKVETCLQVIESDRIDITGSYKEWFSIGCSFANEFGETGRDYFHRVSQFHPKYSQIETDKQYDRCLPAEYDYTIGTFYSIAERHGVTFKDRLYKPTSLQATKPVQIDARPLLPKGWDYDDDTEFDIKVLKERQRAICEMNGQY